MWWHLLIVLVMLGESSGDVRLPGNIVPIHYDIFYTIDLDPSTNFSLYGVSKILIYTKTNTDLIKMHMKDLIIQRDKIKMETVSYQIQIVDFSTEPDQEIIVFKTDQPLREGINYTLVIPFYSNVNDNVSPASGVVISSYYDSISKKEENMVTTYLEAKSARQAFPCFDEPSMKATFSLIIGHHYDYTSISNMPLDATSTENQLEPYWSWSEMSTIKKPQTLFRWDRFKKSFRMSTYLVAFVIAKYGRTVSPSGLANIPFKVWAREEILKQTNYASTIAPKLYTFFENWLQVKLPLPKIDIVAVTDRFGCSENWGLITLAEKTLLYDETETAISRKQYVTMTIAHELIHYWFGDLITMKWWSEVWLKEGFAGFMVHQAIPAVAPIFMYNKLAIIGYTDFMDTDCLDSSVALSLPNDFPKVPYGEISYGKGSSLIRMMFFFIGESSFKEAVRQYLEVFSYSNVEQDDLWKVMDDVSRKNGNMTGTVTVKEIMDTWTKQPGFPVVTVNRDYEENMTCSVTQKRFFSPSGGSEAKSGMSWWVPINMYTEKDMTRKRTLKLQWLSDSEGLTTPKEFNHSAAENEWLLLNYQVMAPYIVNYDSRNWQMLISVLNSDRFENVPEFSRAQLLSDAFRLAWSDLLPYRTALGLTNYLSRETEYLPLKTGLDSLAKLKDILRKTLDYAVFEKYVRRLIADAFVYSKGFKLKKIVTNRIDLHYRQVDITKWACQMMVPECVEQALGLFNRWSTSSEAKDNPIPVDLRELVYCVGVQKGGEAAWQRVLSARNSSTLADQEPLLRALACTDNSQKQTKNLEIAFFSKTLINRIESYIFPFEIISNYYGFSAAKDFIYNRIEDIHKSGRSKEFIGMLLKSLVTQFTTQFELNQFISWRNDNSKYLSGSEDFIEQGMEKAKINIAWLNKNYDEIIKELNVFSTMPVERSIEKKFRKNAAVGMTSFSILIQMLFCISVLV